MKKAICVFIILQCVNAFGQEKTLDIDPVIQRTPVWCWVSVGEMIFNYYNICNINPRADFQCGIIALLGPACNDDCYNCRVPAGSSSVIQNMLRDYPKFARQVCGVGKYSISSKIRNSRITKESLVNEIDNDRPIITGISPNGGFGPEPAHVALIIGYETDDDDLFLIVNDPFPYELFPTKDDPYSVAGGEFLSSGQYKISYSDFTRLGWTKTFIYIR